MKATTKTYTPGGGKLPVGRALLGIVTLGGVAGEIGLQLTQHTGAWDALALITLGLPLAALLLLLGVEHASDLNAAERWGMRAAVALMIGTVWFNSVARTEGALGDVMQNGAATAKHRVELKASLDAKTHEAAEWRLKAANEASHGGCGTVCLSFAEQQKTAEHEAEKIAAEIAAIRIDPQALGFANASVALHVDDATLAVYEPLALPFGLQLVVVFAGSAAFGPRRRETVQIQAPAAVTVPAADDEIEAVSRYLVQLLQAGGKIGSVSELASLTGVHVSNASRAATALQRAGVIRKHRDGQRVALRLVA